MSLAQKIPLSRSLPQYVESKIRGEIAKRGMALPGHVETVNGQIVTVNFDVSGLTLPPVEMPLGFPEYTRLPIQSGDKGCCFPVDFYMGATSGLGTGTATPTLQGNLSTLVWFPVSNKNWAQVPGGGPNILSLYGFSGTLLLDSIAGHFTVSITASGVTIQNAAATSSVAVTASSVEMAFGSSNVTLSSAGVGINGVLTINGMPYLAHQHTLVTTGTGDSGPVLP